MWLAVLVVWGTLLPLAASEGCPEASEDSSSWVRLKPLGHCRDGESTCPYRITFPQLTIQLPKSFRELEKMAREVQSLTQMVNQLKADCRECKERQRMQWNLRTAGGGEDGERIQASRGTVNTKERQQDLPKRDKVAHGSAQKTKEEDPMPVNSGTRQVTLTGMENQRWNTNWDRDSNPSNTKNMAKVREPHTPVTDEREKELQSPRVTLTETSLPGNQDEVQTTRASDYTVDRQQGVSRRVNVVQGTTEAPQTKSTEEDTMLLSSGTKHLSPAGMEKQSWNGHERNPKTSNTENRRGPKGSNPTHTKQVTNIGMENQRWNSSWDRNSNPSHSGHRDEKSGGLKGSDPAHMERTPKNMSRVREPQKPLTEERDQDLQSSTVILTESPLPGNQDEAKHLNPAGMERQSWNTGQEKNPKISRTGQWHETSGGPRESNPAHMGRRPGSMSKVRESQSFLSEERVKELPSPGARLTESALPRNQDEEQTFTASSDTVGARQRQQDIPQRVDPDTPLKTEEDTMVISSATKQLSPVGMGRQKWNTSQERNPKTSSTGHRYETSGGPKGSNPAQTGRRPDSMTKLTEHQAFLSEERVKKPQSPRVVKLSESALSRNQDVSSVTVPTGEEEQDITQRGVQGITQKTDEDTVLSSGRKELSPPTGFPKQRWNTSQERNPKTSSTGHRDETSGGQRGSNPAQTGRRPDSMTRLTEPQSFLSEERVKKPQSPIVRLNESALPRHRDEVQTTKVSGNTVQTREGEQDTPQRGVEGITQETDEDIVLISSGRNKLSPTGISQERNPKTSSTGHRYETSGDPKGSNPAQTGKRPDSMTKLTEHQAFLSEERVKKPQSPRVVKLSESALSRNQDVSSVTVPTGEEEQDITQRGVQGITQKTDEDTVLSSGRKELSPPTGFPKQRWNTSQERNPKTSSTGHRDETSGGQRGSNPAQTGRRPDSMTRLTEPQSFLSEERVKKPQSPIVRLNESALPRHRDEVQTTKVSGNTVQTREGEQDTPQRGVEGITQETDEDIVLISSGRNKLSPTGISQERNPKTSSTGHRYETSGDPKRSNPAQTGKRPDSMTKLTEHQAFLSEERVKKPQSPRVVKLSESALSRNQDVSSVTVPTGEEEQDITQRGVQGVTQKTDEDTVLSSGRKELSPPTGFPKQKWNTSQERNPKTSSTGHRDDTSGFQRGSNPAQTGRRPDSISKVIVSQSPRAKPSESALPRHQDVEQITEVSSNMVNTREGEHDIPKRGNQGITQETEEDTVLISSGRKELSPTATQRQRWNTGQGMNHNQSRHQENQKANTSKVGLAENPSGTLNAKSKIESIPEISSVPVVSEDVHITKQLNPPSQNKPIRRFPGFPRPINTNRKDVPLIPNTDNRRETPGDLTKRPFGNRTEKYFTRGSKVTPVRIGPNGKTLHKVESKEGTGTASGDANLPDTVKNGPKTMDSKNVLEERRPVTGTKAKNNTANTAESTKTVLAQEGEDISDTGAPVVAKEGSTNIQLHVPSENKGKQEKSDHSESHVKPKPINQGNKDSVSSTGVDTQPSSQINTVETVHGSVSDTDDATFDVRTTDPQTQAIQSENPLSPGSRVDPVTPSWQISGPEKIRPDQISDRAETTSDAGHPNPQIQDRNSEHPFRPSTHADSGTGMESSPLNTVETGLEKSTLPISAKDDATGDTSNTNPQSLTNPSKHDLPKGQIKPDLNTARQDKEEIIGSNPIKGETKRQNMLRINNASSLRTDPEKQSPIARRREEMISESVSRPEAPTVGPKVKGRPVSQPIPVRSKELNPHPRLVIQPNQRMVKNITRSMPNNLKQPERTTSTRVIPATIPRQRKPYILHRIPENGSTPTPSHEFIHSKTGPTPSSPKNKIKGTANDTTQSVRPPVARHTTADQVHLEKANPAPTVEAINSLNNQQIQNTLQNSETKLFHVTDPGNPGGKSELDPITDGVREHSVETVMNQNIVSLGGNNQSGPDWDQAVVENTEDADRRKETTPLIVSSVDSNQGNSKTLLTVGSVQNSRGKFLPTVQKVRGTERNKSNYPTTAAAHTIKPAIKEKQSQMTQPTSTSVTTPHFMAQGHAEKAKSTSGVKVSNTHVHHRLKNPSQEEGSKKLTGTRSNSDSRNKEQDPIMQRTGKVGGSSKGKVSYPNSVNRVPNRAGDPNLKIKSTEGPKWSTSSTDSMPHTPAATVASVEGNNGDSNGKSYPVAMDRAGDAKITRERILYESTSESAMKENNERPLTFNELEDRDGLENQLLSTCHGQCNPSSTPQPAVNIRRASESDRDKPPQDCSNLIKRNPRNGVYSVTPAASKNTTFPVFCDMEASGGGWTVIQHRFDGSISFNRTWNDYRRGFGNLTGEFWLGNDKIHWLTSTKAMVLRIELEDLDGVKEYAQYDRFKVANESQHYRLTIGGYSGTAGNAMQFNKRFNHDQKNFTTPDRDNDRYPSGNCGAYYSSGWWFDACMAANLNGKYYQTRYKGMRNGIFWGTWHNISDEYYPTNDRQSFKTVRMMVRPRITGRDY